jgi:hypothetical protein
MAGFFRELAQLISELPDATPPGGQRAVALPGLGGGDVAMDYHSLRLAAACLAER